MRRIDRNTTEGRERNAIDGHCGICVSTAVIQHRSRPDIVTKGRGPLVLLLVWGVLGLLGVSGWYVCSRFRNAAKRAEATTACTQLFGLLGQELSAGMKEDEVVALSSEKLVEKVKARLGGNYRRIMNDPWGRRFRVRFKPDRQFPELYVKSLGEDGRDGTKDDILVGMRMTIKDGILLEGGWGLDKE